MSASNNKWEIAVAVPIKNSYFRYKNRFSATIADIPNTSITLSGLQTTATAHTQTHASSVMAANDRIMLKGTTSKTVDTTTISSVPTTGLVIVTADNMSGDFAIGDTIVGYGNAVPGGWYLKNFAPSVTGHTITRSTGSFDNFSIILHLSDHDTTTHFGIWQALDTEYYIQNLRHRIGFKYKFPNSAGGADWQICLYSNGGYYNKNFITYSQGTFVSSWTAFSDTLYRSSSSSVNYSLLFRQELIEDELINNTNLYIDEVYLEHIYNPVSSKTIYGSTAANSGNDTYVGYYEIDTWADAGSIKWREIEQNSEVILLDKSLEWYDPTGWGERNTKYELTAQFTNASSDVFDKLEALKRIQKNGYSLNLHPYLDELPSVITGKMYLEGVDYTHWDFGLVSFSFRFREI